MMARAVLIVPMVQVLQCHHITVAYTREPLFSLHDFSAVKVSSQLLPDESYTVVAHPKHTAEEKGNQVMAGRRFWCLAPRDITAGSKCGAPDAVRWTYWSASHFPPASTPPTTTNLR